MTIQFLFVHVTTCPIYFPTNKKHQIFPAFSQHFPPLAQESFAWFQNLIRCEDGSEMPATELSNTLIGALPMTLVDVEMPSKNHGKTMGKHGNIMELPSNIWKNNGKT